MNNSDIDIDAIKEALKADVGMQKIYFDGRNSHPGIFSYYHILEAISRIEPYDIRTTKIRSFRSLFLTDLAKDSAFDYGLAVAEPDKLLEIIDNQEVFDSMYLTVYNGLRFKSWILHDFDPNHEHVGLVPISDVIGLSEPIILGPDRSKNLPEESLIQTSLFLKKAISNEKIRGIKYETIERLFKELDLSSFNSKNTAIYTNNLYRSVLRKYRSEIEADSDQVKLISDKMEPFISVIPEWNQIRAYMDLTRNMLGIEFDFETFPSEVLETIIANYDKALPLPELSPELT